MSDAQGDQVHNHLELKNIFNLLNPNSEGEIEIKQINNLISSLDNLKINYKNSGGISGSGENNDQSPGSNQNAGNMNGDSKNDKKSSVQQKGSNSQAQIPKGNNETNQKLATGNSSSGTGQQKNQSGSSGGEKEFVEVMELRYFPNNKPTINFNEFCAYFNECMNNKELQEDLLHSCFNQFDFSDEAYINSKKIKSIFEIFNDKTNQEEIQNVLKFCGVSNDKMSYDEFKQFFEKNL